ncbi:expressed unknown protein [Seminavis robusta]|uniref:Uncharacterized protein n=1 Tax=Seminavis robusta TaxID=568900 RepID=A0A9N8EQV5_9STRA|nr:expressed unknown protein [Seminavis robusta]|eukprot:Sro1818_g299580.1 n/a (131) ;mRNA; f:13014-13406
MDSSTETMDSSSHKNHRFQDKIKSARSRADTFRRCKTTGEIVRKQRSPKPEEGRRRRQSDFVSGSALPRMDPHKIIEMLETYASTDHEECRQCLQSLKNNSSNPDSTSSGRRRAGSSSSHDRNNASVRGA